VINKFKEEGDQPRCILKVNDYVFIGGSERFLTVLNYRDFSLVKKIDIASYYTYCLLHLDNYVYAGS